MKKSPVIGRLEKVLSDLDSLCAGLADCIQVQLGFHDHQLCWAKVVS